MLMLFVMFCLVVAEPSKEFSIRPSKDDSVSVDLQGVVCSFSWKDCTGGSSELWHISIKAKNNGPECSIGRPRDSYLTFTNWKAELNGEGLSDAQVAVYSGSGQELLRNSDFKVDLIAGKVTVSNAKNDRLRGRPKLKIYNF